MDCIGGWKGCSVTCGVGVDTFEVKTAAAYGGKACDFAADATKSCQLAPCGVDCVGGWASGTTEGWGSCSSTCGYATQDRTYKVTTKSAGAGKSCPYADGYKESRQCTGLPACPQPVDCVGKWSGWSGCSKGCGGGTQTASYTVEVEALNGGKACPSKTGDTKSQACNTTSCCDPTVYTKGTWRDVRGSDGKTVGPVNCDGRSGDGRPYVLQEMPITFPTNANGPASIVECQLTGLTQYRYTGLGCADRDPTGGSCSAPGVTWDRTNGCTVTPATYTTGIGGTCSPTGNPWTSSGCTQSPSEKTPDGGTCSITGVNWSSTNGCKISPSTRQPTYRGCTTGTWNGTACAQSPTEMTPTGGTCTNGGSWSTGGCSPAASTPGTATACSAGTLTNGVCQNTTARYCSRQLSKGGCEAYSTKVTAYGQVSTYTCPSGYTPGGATGNRGTCTANQPVVASLTCPTNYTGDNGRNICVGVSGTVNSLDCSNFAGYEADLNAGICNAKAVTITDLTCPAGYSKDTATNKCKAVTGTVATVTGCPSAYNQDTANNRCTAKSATISSLTCGNTDQFKGNTGTNKCVAWA